MTAYAGEGALSTIFKSEFAWFGTGTVLFSLIKYTGPNTPLYICNEAISSDFKLYTGYFFSASSALGASTPGDAEEGVKAFRFVHSLSVSQSLVSQSLVSQSLVSQSPQAVAVLLRL
jgi:hypothetical protein